MRDPCSKQRFCLPLWREERALLVINIKEGGKPKSSGSINFIQFPEISSGSIPFCYLGFLFRFFGSIEVLIKREPDELRL